MASSAEDLYVNTVTLGNGYGGYVQLKGKAKKVTANISGSAYFDAKSLLADTAIVKTRNSGGAELYVMDYMDVDIDAANQVLYRGQPAIKKKERNLLGKLINYNLPRVLAERPLGE